MLKKGFTSLTNDALATLASSTMRIINEASDVKLKDNELFTQISGAYNNYMRVLNKRTYSGMGKDVDKKDSRRDQLFMGLKEIVTGFSRWASDKSQYRPAIDLLPLFELNKDIGQKTYAQQTSALRKLCTDLQNETNAPKVEALGLTDLVTYLNNANTNFGYTYVEQVDANSALRQLGTATELRKPLEEALKKFYTFVEAMKDTPSWKDCYYDLSELMTRIKY